MKDGWSPSFRWGEISKDKCALQPFLRSKRLRVVYLSRKERTACPVPRGAGDHCWAWGSSGGNKVHLGVDPGAPPGSPAITSSFLLICTHTVRGLLHGVPDAPCLLGQTLFPKPKINSHYPHNRTEHLKLKQTWKPGNKVTLKLQSFPVNCLSLMINMPLTCT